MTVRKNLDQQVDALVDDPSSPDANGTQFDHFSPQYSATLTPRLKGAKGAFQGSPGSLPPGMVRATCFQPDPLQKTIVDADGNPASGRPRCFGEIRTVTPDDAGLFPGGGFDGVSGTTMHYRMRFYVPADCVIPLSHGGDPFVIADWHGENGPDPLDPSQQMLGQPTLQFHMKRMTDNAKQGFYVRMWGGRWKDDDGTDPVGWTPEGSVSGKLVECSREYDLYPPAELPRGVWHDLIWSVDWSHVMGDGRIQAWMNDPRREGAPVVDTTTTIPVSGPSDPDNSGANIFHNPSGYVQSSSHSQWGYYRPLEGPDSADFYEDVWTQRVWLAGILIADDVADVTDVAERPPLQPDPDRSMLVVPDTHIGLNRPDRWMKVRDQVANPSPLFPAVALKLHIGDVLEGGGPDELLSAPRDPPTFEAMDALAKQWLADMDFDGSLPGNHDINQRVVGGTSAESYAQWRADYGVPRVQVWDFPDFLALGSYYIFNDVAGQGDLADMKALADAADKPVIVCTHYPIAGEFDNGEFSVPNPHPRINYGGPGFQGQQAGAGAANFKAMVNATPNIVAHVHGHTHMDADVLGYVSRYSVGTRSIVSINTGAIQSNLNHGVWGHLLCTVITLHEDRLEVRMWDAGADRWAARNRRTLVETIEY